MLCDFCLTITPELLHSGKNFKFQNSWEDIVASVQGGCAICEQIERDSGTWWKGSMSERVELTLWALSAPYDPGPRLGTMLCLALKHEETVATLGLVATYSVYIPRGNLNIQLISGPRVFPCG
jgi:hypothetical protein